MRGQKVEAGISCPSAQPDAEDSVIFGVILGGPGARKVGYLSETRPVTPATLAVTGEVWPTEVFRIAAPCAEAACKHFAGSECSLVRRMVEHLAPVVGGVPPCGIRKTCRWFRQEGKAACSRCPQVVTDRRDASELEMLVATGYATVEQPAG